MAKGYVVGTTVNTEKLAEYRVLLEAAYQNGEDRGGSMDWNDVQKALEKAVEALGAEAQDFLNDAAEYLIEDPTINFAVGVEETPEFVSACQLIAAHYHPDQTDWEDVDRAYQTLVESPAPRM